MVGVVGVVGGVVDVVGVSVLCVCINWLSAYDGLSVRCVRLNV